MNGEVLPFSYYRRLSARQRRIYDQSDSVGRVELPRPDRLQAQVDALAGALGTADRRATETAATKLSASILSALHVSGVRVRVLATRPSHDWGELHGLYEPDEGKRPLITVWMRTAQRKQVVAFKTFFRTLLHELNHHLDYELLQLDDSYHTQGFYKRESSLFHQLVPDPSRYDPRTRGKPRSKSEPGTTSSAAQTTRSRSTRAAADMDGSSRAAAARRDVGATSDLAASSPVRSVERAPRVEQTKLPFADE